MLPPIQIVFEDAHVLVLNKPSGLLSVPGRGADKQDCLSARVQARYPDALVVHRLDMATSGLVLMARSLRTQQTLSAAFEARAVNKRYVAIVAGQPAVANRDWATISMPIVADWPNRPKQMVDAARGKPSHTLWRAAPAQLSAACGFDNFRVELEPITGRTHQLRVHMAAIGYPILGDALYAPPPVAACVNRLMLHATYLAFAHPETQAPMEFHSPEPF